MNDEPIVMHINIKGNVQGVGFRYTTVEHARKLGIKGTVRNHPDGSVEILAVASRNVIDQLLTALKTDFAGYISDIHAREEDDTHSFSDFNIIR